MAIYRSFLHILIFLLILPTMVSAQNAKDFTKPIDPQNWQDQETMTWDNYKPIPGLYWADTSLIPERKLSIALVAVDFDDQAFVITQGSHSDPFGNPQIDAILREYVPQFYAEFYNKPSEINHGQTINGYWMEQSGGKVGIPPMDFYGPYRLPKKLFQYGLNEFNQQEGCPPGYVCDGRLAQDCDALWRDDAGQDIKSQYDIVLRIYAGYDETSVWQEFGEMMFNTKEDIPDEWGNIDSTMANWVTSRYVPWTSWKAGQMNWGSSSMEQAESSGTITHEIAHYAFQTGDNNNNPYVEPYRRVASGPWDVMDRGSFNGPGGPHQRWVVPAAEGASMPAGLMLRSRLNFDFVTKDQILELDRNDLDSSGLAVARVIARAVQPDEHNLAGIKVNLDGRYQDMGPDCDRNTDPLCPGASVFNYYSMEVVQRIGYDSFTPDNGVLIAKNKNNESNSCGYNCFTWVIDAHPEDINMLDFYRPDGTRVMRTVADYRQLNDALFHAGNDSGSENEYIDEHNRLHFYILDTEYDNDGVLSYTIGIRSLDGSGPHKHGVKFPLQKFHLIEESFKIIPVSLINTGKQGTNSGTFHPADATDYLGNDIYRLSFTVVGEGWDAHIQNNLVAVPFGKSLQIPIGITRSPNASKSARIELTAISESNPDVRARSVIKVMKQHTER